MRVKETSIFIQYNEVLLVTKTHEKNIIKPSFVEYFIDTMKDISPTVFLRTYFRSSISVLYQNPLDVSLVLVSFFSAGC